jgi:hypothetical protein
MKETGELRQGDLLNENTVKMLCQLAVQQPFNQPTENSLCMVLTQDCDIVHGDISEEPYVEFILCNPIQILDGNKLNGKNPRLIQIQNDQQKFEISIHDRFMVKKKNIAKQKLETSNSKLSADNVKIIKKWVARRYTRSAFPDAFNSRLSKSKGYQRIATKEISEHVSHVFFEVEEVELSSDQNYNLNVLIVVDEDGMKNKTEIEVAYENAFLVEGINSNILVSTEDDVSLYDLRNYKRWDQKDSYSLNGQASPVNEIDTY